MFIGRKDELDFLSEKYNSDEAQLVVLYGRRRIGKTETLKEFSKGKSHVFYSCTECIDSKQLTSFGNRVLDAGVPAARYIRAFVDWEQALLSLAEYAENERRLVIIDEFPYMVKGNPQIPSILQTLWDEKLKDTKLMLVLCGSSMSFIEKEILSEKNPLYGRATGILKMKAMGFYDSALFFPKYNYHDKIRAYAILGGIPHYLRQFDSKTSLEENICKSILQRGSILYSEVEFLMRQELREPTIYNTIIEAIALGNTKLNDIYNKTGIEKNKLVVYIKNLIDLGIVEKELPAAHAVKEAANLHRGLYHLTDNYFRFWYSFVFPNLSELETGDSQGVLENIVMPELDRFASLPFEKICIEYLRKQNRQGDLPFRFSSIGRWWHKDVEIDILATNPERNKFLISECKYRNSCVEVKDIKKLMDKFEAGNAESVNYCMFSKGGFSEQARSFAREQGNIALVSAEEVAENKA